MKVEKEDVKICSICSIRFTEWGNNAEPVNSGICCDSCNSNVVIPNRVSFILCNVFQNKKDEDIDTQKSE
jgi:DNA-directed RNA polymerase subunit RPC12/RpoP